jgi:flagellar L-ring protein precursor FlgH
MTSAFLPSFHPSSFHRTVLASTVAAALLTGCAASLDSGIVPGPRSATAIPHPGNIERVNNGAIFQPGMSAVNLFSDDRKPRSVGDTLKVNIVENLTAANKSATDTKSESALAQKGPGAKAGMGLFSSIMNLDVAAAGSNSFQGNGQTSSSTQFKGQVAATVINVLPNGNLVVAGERTIALNGGVNLLRFSGTINPKDIQAGNTIASTDAVNARVELVGAGEVSDAASRSWIQRVLTESLSFW